MIELNLKEQIKENKMSQIVSRLQDELMADRYNLLGFSISLKLQKNIDAIHKQIDKNLEVISNNDKIIESKQIDLDTVTMTVEDLLKQIQLN